MLDIVKLGEELATKLQHETDLLMADRLMTREVLAARLRELASRREEELQRIDQFASQQKALVREVFAAMIGEIEADSQRNEANLARMKGEAVPAEKPAVPAKVRQLKAAE